jgi:hypothetical protein
MFFSIFSEIAAAWISGGRYARGAIGTALLSAAAAFLVNVFVSYGILGGSWSVLLTSPEFSRRRCS